MEVPYIQVETETEKKKIRLTERPLTIGRHPENRLSILDKMASRFHCVVEFANRRFSLRDLASSNGTQLNGDLVREAELTTGDVFTIGDTKFEFFQPQDFEADRALQKSPAKSHQYKETEIHEDFDIPGFDDDDEPTAPRQTNRVDMAPAAPREKEQSLEEELQAAEQLEKLLQQRSHTDSGEQSLSEASLELINARGEVVHEATDPNARKKARHGDRKWGHDAGTHLLRRLLLVCVKTHATDLHGEPRVDHFIVRVRVDGMMVEIQSLPSSVCQRVLGVVKVLSDIEIGTRNVIQEGHFSSAIDERRIDYRVSFTPSSHGQKLVIRVLDLANAPKHMEDLNLPPWMFQTVRKTSKQDSGMVLVTGPTGSGKTTTLYTVLRQINVRQRNVITIEDPVEYQIEGVTQIPINDDQGNSFNTLLRSVLRQDPDVILLGEVRDSETASTAMQAAMTGHLVLSTVHAKDTIGTVFRLLDLGMEPYLVAASLNIILAQRLVRVLCPNCKVDKKPTPAQTMQLGRTIEGLDKIYIPNGCTKCLSTGYTGRRGLFEMLQVTDELRDVILKTPSIEAIRKAIQMSMFVSLRQSGLQLVEQGNTSMEEVDRVTTAD